MDLLEIRGSATARNIRSPVYAQPHINVLPAKLIVSPLTCTFLIDPTKEDDGAACPLVLLSMSRPGGTPPMYQLS